MQDIFNSISSTGWWFSTILIALLINLISAYAKPWVDTVLSRFSKNWRARNERASKEFENNTELLVASPQALAYTLENEVRTRLNSIFLFVCATLLLLLSVLLATKFSTQDETVRFTARWFFVLGLNFLAILASIAMMMTHGRTKRYSQLAIAARVRLIHLENMNH